MRECGFYDVHYVGSGLIGEDEILSILFCIAIQIPHEIYIYLLSNIFRGKDEAPL